MTIAFYYQYRDGSNFKSSTHVYLKSEEDRDLEQLEEEISQYLDEGRYFIAHQLGLPETFLWDGGGVEDYDIDEQTDHCWHEFSFLKEFGEKDSSMYAATVEELLDRLETADEEGWKTFDPGDERP